MVENPENIAKEICNTLKEKGFNVEESQGIILVPDKSIVEVAKYLKCGSDFDLLYSVSGVDCEDCYEAVYHFASTKTYEKIVIKCRVSKLNPSIKSISDVYKTADWHERETYDLMGIRFQNHPNLKRILLPEDWVGHPLRKDYVQDDTRLEWNER